MWNSIKWLKSQFYILWNQLSKRKETKFFWQSLENLSSAAMYHKKMKRFLEDKDKKNHMETIYIEREKKETEIDNI